MTVRKNKRKFNFSDAHLSERKDSLALSLTNDLGVLTEYGLTGARIMALDPLKATFDAILTDNIYMGQMMLAGNARDAAKDDLYLAMDDLRAKVEAIWPQEAQERKLAYGLDGPMRELNVVDLLQKGKKVKLIVAASLADFPAAYNINTGLMTAWQALIDDLDAKNTLYDAKITLRKNKTNERIAAGNALYDAMMELANIGKNYWENRNATRFEEYVITLNPAPPAPILDTIYIFPTDGSVMELGIPVLSSPITADTSMLWENVTAPGSPVIQVWFGALITDPPTPENLTLPNGTTENHIAGDVNYDTINFRLFGRCLTPGITGTLHLVVNG